MKTKKIIIITTLSFLIVSSVISCRKVTNPIGKQDGYKPVYKSAEQAYAIKLIEAQPYTNPGKINQYGQYTLQLDNDKGVHIIDCSNVSSPKKIAFLQVPGCTEMAIKNDVLYIDNYSDLVSITIDNMSTATELQRVKNAFVIANEMAPPFSKVYFECVDKSKGPVVKWIPATLDNPNCKTF